MNNTASPTVAAITETLKTIYDPEIPVNIYDLGLIYLTSIDPQGNVRIDMTLTAPHCPLADFIVEEVRTKVLALNNVHSVSVNLVFEPPWNPNKMSDEAKLELGLL